MKRIELIERYLQGEMTSEEAKAFEMQVRSDAELAKELDEARMVNELVILKGLYELDTQVKQWQPDKSGGPFSIWKASFIISLFMLLCGGIMLMVYYNHEPIVHHEPSAAQPEKQLTIDDRPSKDTLKTLADMKPTPESPAVEQPQPKVPSIEKKTPGLPKTLPAPEPFLTHKTDAVGTDTTDMHVTKSDTVLEPIINLDLPAGAKTETPEHTSSCTGHLIQARIRTARTCWGAANGRLHIDEISGGMAPYTILIDQKQFIDSRTYDQLAAGFYELIIKDQNECLSVPMVFEITSKSCHDRKEAAFAPLQGQEFVFPVPDDFNGTIMIFNVHGTAVYETSIRSGWPSSWNGTDKYGNLLPKDSYIYQIFPQNGPTYHGNVSILY